MSDHDKAKALAPDGATHYILHDGWEMFPTWYMHNNSGWFVMINGEYRMVHYDPAKYSALRSLELRSLD